MYVAEIEIAGADARADIPRALAVAHVGGERCFVELESAAVVAERGLVLGVAERNAGEQALGQLHVAADRDRIHVIAAAVEVSAVVVVAIVVDGVGVELVLRARRVQRRPHPIVDSAEIRLLDLQRRFGEQADFLRRLEHRGRVVGDHLVCCRRRMHTVGKDISLCCIRRNQRR